MVLFAVAVLAATGWRISGQGFGSYSDLPFLAASASAGCTYPEDSFSTYTTYASLDGLNGGCGWSGAYVVHGTNIPPCVMMSDTLDTYTTGAVWTTSSLRSGIGWSTLYVFHTVEPVIYYADGFQEYATNSAISTQGGTNYYFSYYSNSVVIQAWTNSSFVTHTL